MNRTIPQAIGWQWRMGFTLGLFLLPLMAGGSPAAEKLFSQGNEAYAAGDYGEAVANYERGAALAVSPELLFNLGHAYRQLDRTGPAILAFERALALDPGYEPARSSLRRLRAEQGAPDPARGPLADWLQRWPLTAWTWICAGGFWVFVALLLLPRVFDRSGGGIAFLRVVSAVAFLVSVAALLTYHREGQRAIVVEPETVLRVAPAETSAQALVVESGTSVRVTNRHPGFLFVELDDGSAGWADAEAVGRIWD